MAARILIVDDEAHIRETMQMALEAAAYAVEMAADGAATPLLFRTLNGYKFWDAPLPAGEEETEALRIRRAFEVKSPAGETRCCVIELTTCVRELVRLETDHDYPPADEFWLTVCRGAL